METFTGNEFLLRFNAICFEFCTFLHFIGGASNSQTGEEFQNFNCRRENEQNEILYVYNVSIYSIVLMKLFCKWRTYRNIQVYAIFDVYRECLLYA